MSSVAVLVVCHTPHNSFFHRASLKARTTKAFNAKRYILFLISIALRCSIAKLKFIWILLRKLLKAVGVRKRL